MLVVRQDRAACREVSEDVVSEVDCKLQGHSGCRIDRGEDHQGIELVEEIAEGAALLREMSKGWNLTKTEIDLEIPTVLLRKVVWSECNRVSNPLDDGRMKQVWLLWK